MHHDNRMTTLFSRVKIISHKNGPYQHINISFNFRFFFQRKITKKNYQSVGLITLFRLSDISVCKSNKVHKYNNLIAKITSSKGEKYIKSQRNKKGA